MTQLSRWIKHLISAHQQQREIKRLTARVEQLQRENASMRAGMRRCITCDYRRACKNLDNNN